MTCIYRTITSLLVVVYRPFSAQIWLYQRRKATDGQLSLPSEERPAKY